MNHDADTSNEENKPVEELTMSVTSVGVVRCIKALDPYWLDKREWCLYQRLPTGKALVLGALDAWKMNTEALNEDLKFLLSLKHHKFWSHIIYEPVCMDMLVSFLQEAVPPYMEPPSERAIRELYEQVRRRVANVFCRLITNKETKSEWMSKGFLAKTVYENYIFSIPTLWDICLVYGTDNPQNVSRIVNSVFTLQPKYLIDLETAINFVQEVFKYTIMQVNKSYDNSVAPPNLPETFKGFSEFRRPSRDPTREKLTFDTLRDLIIHMLDSVLTIRVFIDVFVVGAEVLKKRGFVLSIVQLYEYALPCMHEKLDELGDEASIAHAKVSTYLEMARGELIDIVKSILAANTNAILSNEGSVASHVAEYLTIMMDVLSEKMFVKDYNANYPVHEDLEMLKQAYPNIDPVKTDFILQAIYCDLDDLPPLEYHQPSTAINGYSQSPEQTNVQTEAQSNSTDIEIPSNVKEESLISEVKDILPHLGEGFILKCLQHYGFNAERVINGVLEGTLDKSLQALDQSLPIIPEDPLDNHFLETGIQRLNVFDGDEFDLMHRDDVDLSRIHVGKKGKIKDLKKMMEDKSDVRKRMDIYSKYNLVVDEEDMYSDEYDDTYDAGGAAAVDNIDESRRPIVKPRILRQVDKDSTSDESEAEEPANEPQASGAARPSADGGKRMDFCVNPELMRERREANRRANQKPTKQPPKGGDVVGKAKGQGQEKEVLVNRDRKNQSKSSRANHNRRQGAQWKRTQGMMPS